MKYLKLRIHLPACILLSCMVGLLVAGLGCKRQESDKPQVALVMKSLANEFFKTMEEGAVAHQQEHSDKYDLIAVGIKDEEDVAAQVRLMEQMIARRVDAIVLAPADSEAMVPICQRAMQGGITVVNIDNKLDSEILKERDIQVPFVGPDNRKGARMAGEYLAKHLEPGDPVAIIEGIPSAFNGIQRKLGFEDAMKAAGMEIVSSQSAYWEQAKAETLVSAMITEHEQIKALLCANDSMAQGAVAALGAAGKLGDVFVVGFDNTEAAQQLIREGKMLCTVDQHGDEIAVYGIEYAMEMLSSGAAPSDKETPVDLITAETLQ